MDGPNEIQATILTKDDITALKLADGAICFYHLKPTNNFGVGQGQVRAIRERNDKIFSSSSAAQRIIYAFSKIRSYVEDEAYNIPACANCYEHNPVYTDASELHTWINFLRVGDQLSMEWLKDCYTWESMRDGDLHLDKLRVHVLRGKADHVFLMSVQISKNNTARMIRFF